MGACPSWGSSSLARPLTRWPPASLGVSRGPPGFFLPRWQPETMRGIGLASSTSPCVCARGRRGRPSTRRCRPWGLLSWPPHQPIPSLCPTRMPCFGRGQRGAWWKPSAYGPPRVCPGGTAADQLPRQPAQCPCRRCMLQGRGRAKPRRADGERGARARCLVEAMAMGRGAASPQTRAVRALDL
jgi:hypothetical protein